MNIKSAIKLTFSKHRQFITVFFITGSLLLPSFLSNSFLIPVKGVLAQTEETQESKTQKTIFKIGVLANLGDDAAIQKWQATADYLSSEIPEYSFEVVPLDFEEINQAVRDNTIDFAIGNPGFYVTSEVLYGTNRIATLKNLRLGDAYTVFGGVIFRRADRNDIQTLEDIKGKKLMAVDETAFGGWQMQWREIQAAGVNPSRDLEELTFSIGDTHDEVVYAVRDGVVDVGAIRTDTLERMVKEGKINLEDFTVINKQDNLGEEFPFLVSTSLYPEWPFLVARGTPNEVSEQVASALLRIPKDSPAAVASNSEGWTVPLNYRPVDDLFLELNIGHYENLGELTLIGFLTRYWYLFAIGSVSVIVIIAGLIIYQQKRVEATLKANAEQQRQQREELEKDVAKLMEDVEDAVDGDLNVQATLSAGDIGILADLFNAIVENLKETVIQVKQTTGEVNYSLTHNEKSIQELAQQAIAEAEEIRQTLGSMEQMSYSIQNVADNANEAANISDIAYNTVQQGNTTMDKTVESILTLRSTVSETAKKIKRLGESAQKISQVVSSIDEISLKTNLLAVNASVEAARAGELGQGFTAVAEQVAALAEQSSKATKEIAETATAIQIATQEVVEAIEIGTNQVVNTTELVDNTKENLVQVLDISEQINQLMQSISTATTSQAQTSQKVTELMQKVTQNSEQRTISSQNMAQAVRKTAEIARDLQSSVEQFKVDTPREIQGEIQGERKIETVATKVETPETKVETPV